MKTGVRAAGVAESFTQDRSTVAGIVARADRVIDGFAFTTITVGGTDATDRLIALLDRLLREDVRYVLVAGIAPAWYNIVDLQRVHESVARPVCAVTFEASEGLEPALRREFDEAALDDRLAVYRRLPQRDRLTVNDETLFVRAVGLDDHEARDVVRAFTPAGGRPEPLRVARLAARAADQWREDL